MYLTGQVHLASAIVALASGAWVVLRPKGTATHRRVGWVYAISMLVLSVTVRRRFEATTRPFRKPAL